MIELKDIVEAAAKLRGVIHDTPLYPSEVFSRENDQHVFIKPENLQVTGAFKIRGAYNKIARLGAEDRRKGLIASSAGNHAQGVAYASQLLGAASVIVMPKPTPLIKVEATRKYGAQVVLFGDMYDEAYEEARRLEKENGYLFIHPFDDWDVMAGQGTIGLEILNDLPDCDIILVPVGGGGLISGIAVAVKAMNPKVKVIGVEPEGALTLKTSLEKGKVTRLDTVRTIAEGVAVRTAGEMTFEVVKKYVDDIISVSDYDLQESFLLLLEKHKQVAENAGVLSLAALKKLPQKGMKVVSLVSGGNIDVLTISAMINQGLVSRGRIFCFSVELTDKPGELLKITTLLSKCGANIIQLDHNRFKSLDRLTKVQLEATVETNGWDHLDEITKAMKEGGFEIVRVY
ncbi:MAG: threonine ammonia-lyase [Treponemataceae bacterium]